MLQFVIIAEDGTDDEALARRMAARSAHLEGAKNLKSAGNYVLGGAMLSDAGTMTGSVMIVQFETEEALNDWLSREPYISGKVWQNLRVKAFKVADV